MKCKNCKKENPEGTKYCKFCGELLYDMKTCPNGHQYYASEKYCPYCPPPEQVKAINSDNIKTVAENYNINTYGDDKTVLDNSKVVMSQNGIDLNDKTVVASPDESKIQLEKIQSGKSRKLIGWLVTFDINPNGKDFKLYEGKTTIGKSDKNDIIILDPSVSSTHATILYRPLDKKLFIQDNLSTNGTFVNGNLIDDKQVLSDNDIITIGKINLKVKLI